VKNFPHQYNQFAKLRATFETLRDLDDDGKRLDDDAVVGYELARRGIYTFRGDVGSLAERIAAERRKPSRSQGPQTAAREMRRTLRYLGWLDEEWSLTAAGTAFLETAPGSTEERVAWQQAVLDLRLADDDGVSHPVRILLRLVRDHEIVARRGMELALEARDDSEEEYRRVAALVALSPDERVRRLGITTFTAANATKILPAFAEQAGLIERDGARAPYRLTAAGRAALGEGLDARRIEPPENGVSRGPRQVPASTVRAARRPRRGLPREVSADQATPAAALAPEEWAALTPDEQIAAMRLRFERSERHQRMLERLVELRRGAGASLLEDRASFDLLEVPPGDGPLTLYELKTLESDASTQVRLAVGQLLMYAHLNVAPAWPGRSIRLAAVFEARIAEQLAAVLGRLEIAAFALHDGRLDPLNEAAQALEAIRN